MSFNANKQKGSVSTLQFDIPTESIYISMILIWFGEAEKKVYSINVFSFALSSRGKTDVEDYSNAMWLFGDPNAAQYQFCNHWHKMTYTVNCEVLKH